MASAPIGRRQEAREAGLTDPHDLWDESESASDPVARHSRDGENGPLQPVGTAVMIRL